MLIPVRRALQYTVLVSYLLITFAAFLFTVFRVRVPLLPWPLVHWAYGMMAPYQGEIAVNGELRAEGIDERGGLHTIDLAPYFPVGFGERNVRMYLRTFYNPKNMNAYQAKYRQMAERIQAIEKREGRSFASIRLWWDTWPRSVDGFYALKKAPDLQSEFIVSVP